MFLSAPYAESTFSFLNFTGCYLYAKSLVKASELLELETSLFILSSSILFGIATTIRGNGLFSGLTLIYDAIVCVTKILRFTAVEANIRRLLVVSIAGSLMASIAIVPQYLAYAEYCTGQSANVQGRPWCSKWIPSIYAWVQEHYW